MDSRKAFKRVGTHHGRFHGDEVMATAILKEIFDIEFTRTRDEKILRELDIVYDVGGGEFDHHGIEKEYRENGIPYAACGLLWREFGREAVRYRESNFSEEEIETVYKYVDRSLIEGIDAVDNGIWPEDSSVSIMHISTVISNFNPPWYMEKSEDDAFKEAVELASKVLENTINSKISVLKSRGIVLNAYNNRTLPEVLVLNEFCPWGENLRDIDERNEVLYVVYPSKENYAAQTVRGKNREDKKPFPPAWAGKRDEELAAITGVNDSVFCHSGRFIAVAGSFEGIMRLVNLSIKAPEERRRKFRIFDFIIGFFERR